jgi:hypothetical protein
MRVRGLNGATLLEIPLRRKNVLLPTLFYIGLLLALLDIKMPKMRDRAELLFPDRWKYDRWECY